MPRRSALLTALLLAPLSGALGAQEGDRQGVSVIVDPNLAVMLEDARRLLADGSHAAAIETLQKVVEAPPEVLIPDPAGNRSLYLGASMLARRMLEELPPEARELRRRLLSRKARARLEEALLPPDPARLRRVVDWYPGTEEAELAARALEELLLDRGLVERAAGGRPLDEVLPEAWIPALPPAGPRSGLEVPAYKSLEDPRIPLVRAAGCRWRWTFRFESSPFRPFHYTYTGHRLALGGGRGYLTDGREVVALQLATGKVLWRYVQDAWTREGVMLRMGEVMRNAFSPDTLLAPVLADGLLVVPYQEPVAVGREDEFNHISVRHPMPARRLYAFDAASGEIRWRQEVPWLGPGLTRSEDRPVEDLVAAPPAIENGVVYVPVYSAKGTLHLSLLALDLHTGEELWRTSLVSGQRESNLFGNVLHELACAPPLVRDGRVLVCTNLGAVCAVDATSGRSLWTRIYERTVVHTPQNGHEARRPVLFENSPGAADGERWLCTPTDSPFALLLDAGRGEQLAFWRTSRVGRGGRGDSLRALIALLPQGGFWSGRRASFQPVAGQAGLAWRSRDLFTDFIEQENLYAGVLARDELLIPAADHVLRLDPRSGRVLGPAFAWETEGLDAGPLQAAPGMLFVLHPNGVSAFTSPMALAEFLEGLAAAEETPAEVGDLLPFLEGLDLRGERATALRVAAAARSLAGRARSLEAGLRLRLVTGRALLDAGEGREAARELAPLLEDKAAAAGPLGFEAALTIVEALEGLAPESPAVTRALARLESEGERLVVRADGRHEPLRVTLGRLRFLRARSAGNAEAQRRELTALLLHPEAAALTDAGGRRLEDWAQAELELLLRDPALARNHEEEAARRLAAGPVDRNLLRAFEGTRAVDAWLERAAAGAAGRAEEVRLAAWARDFARDRRRFSDLLDPVRLLGPPEPPLRLPGDLEVVAAAALSPGGTHPARELLAAGPVPDGAGGEALLLVREGQSVSFLRLNEGGLEEGASFPALGSGFQPLPHNLGDGRHAFLLEDGAVLIYRDRWLHLGLDGNLREERLPGPCEPMARPLRLGRMLALLCETGEDRFTLQVRDLATAEVFLERILHRSHLRSLEMLWSGGRLLVLQDRSRNALRFDLLEGGPGETLHLEAAPNGRSLDFLLPWGEGGAAFLLPHFEEPALVLHDGQRSWRLPLPAEAEARLFRTPSGLGLHLEPFLPGTGEPSGYQLWFLPEGSGPESAPRILDLGEQALRCPQVDGDLRHPFVLPDDRFLVLAGEEAGRTRVRCLDPSRIPAADPVWELDIQGLSFRNIQRSKPNRLGEPVRAENGWLLPILAQNRPRGRELVLLLLDEEGRPVDHYEGPGYPRGTRGLRVLPVAGRLLVHSPDSELGVVLLGRNP